MTTTQYTYRFLQGASEPEVFDSIRRSYLLLGYPNEISDQDQFVLALKGPFIIGVVRLCKEYDVQTLRGMIVKSDHHRNGAGSGMLAELAKHAEPVCFCLPYAHLDKFYAQIGFRGANEMKIPLFLQERLEQYRKHNPDKQYIAMVRKV